MGYELGKLLLLSLAGNPLFLINTDGGVDWWVEGRRWKVEVVVERERGEREGGDIF